MPGPIYRNLVVKYFGTPDATDGSVNEPREHQEHGMRFNEKWTYHHLGHDPAGAVQRMVYWRRYDFIGSMIRKTAGAEWQKDESLPAVLAPTGSTDTYVPGA